MAIAIANQKAANTGSGSPFSVTSLTSSTAGNCIAVGIIGDSITGTVTGVTDNKSQTYVQATTARATDSGLNQFADWWLFPNTASGVTSVTITVSGGTNDLMAVVYELSGVATSSPQDGSGVVVNNGASTNTPVSGALTTSTSNDIALALCAADQVAAGVTLTVGGSYIINTTALNKLAATHIISGTVTNETATFTISGGVTNSFCTSTIALKPAAGSSFNPGRASGATKIIGGAF